MRRTLVLAVVLCAHFALWPLRCTAQPKRVYIWPTSGAPSTQTQVLAASPGYEVTVAIALDRTLTGWGLNRYGQRGLPYGSPLCPSPQPGSPALGTCYLEVSHCYSLPEHCVPPPPNMPPLCQISASWDHVLALTKPDQPGYTATRGLLAWGRNDSNHQAEIPDLWDPAGPWQIAAEAKVATISAGEYINVVLFDNGQVACWGDNTYGVDPRPLPPGEHPHLPADMPFHPDYSMKFKEAVAGGHFVALLTTTGEIVTYGAMTYGADPTGHWSESKGMFGPGFRGGPSLSGPWAINNEGTVPNLPLKYRPPYRGLATTHHSLMALVDPERADHPEDAWLLDMWGANSGNVRLNQPLPDKMRFLELAGGSYQPWVVAKDLNSGELVAWGNTIAQVLPSPAPFGAFEVRPGNSNIQVVALCYDPNCDGSTTAPVLTAGDFQCFQNAFAAAQSLSYEEQIKSYANCDGSTTVPVLTGNDWICFSNKYAAGGCP